ncbi:DUF192 domain-containing protein [Altererythrobacter soli]|uniref:DUF192 domain-containing protein n=2 Tax=Croceibacterium soli TaxID=1739690 RepID=A0A6I4UTF6_9SPHN|nr:DUF192 domain-containing protein [Croceibacterium soli]
MILGAFFAASIACCAPQAAEPVPAAESPSAAVHPVSGLEVIPLTISQDGKEHRFRVEVAKTDAEQGRGLMFRTEMGPDEGMLFPTERPQARSFWMKNTVIPLDLIFVGPDGRITNIAANAVPYTLEPIPSSGPAIAVLELNGGRAAELGIRPGARVTW